MIRNCVSKLPTDSLHLSEWLVLEIKKRYCLTIIALWDTTFPSNRIVIFGLYQIV